jgi:hypothetical protein
VPFFPYSLVKTNTASYFLHNVSCKFSHSWSLAALALVVVTGCSDLKPVADFGKNASGIAAYTGVSQDYPASLLRLKQYGFTGKSVSPERIAKRAQDAKRLSEAQNALAAYAKALGGLTADDLTNYDKQIDALNKAVTDGKFATTAQTAGYAKLTKFAAQFATDAYRREKLKHLIVTYNPAVQKATTQLGDVVKVYVFAVGDEQAYWASAVERARKHNPTMLPIINVIAANQDQMLKTKQNNAKDLGNGLQIFARGHQELAKNIGKVDFKVTASIAQKYADQLRAILSSFTNLPTPL